MNDLIQLSGEGRERSGGDGCLWQPSGGRRKVGVEGRKSPPLGCPGSDSSPSDVRKSLGRYFALAGRRKVVKNISVSDVKVVCYYWR